MLLTMRFIFRQGEGRSGVIGTLHICEQPVTFIQNKVAV